MASGCTSGAAWGSTNLSIFDVRDNERLHEILWNLPLFPHMDIEIAAAQHPSAIEGAAA